MSKRISLVILFIIIPVFARRGGGGHHGGYHGSHSSHHTYPVSTGLSGTHNYGHNTGVSHTNTKQSATYPQSPGLSGNNQHNTYVHKTEVHHHHHYSPPQQINYGSGYHPVYQMSPPVYVYQYRDSGSRFDNLLTGLALYNLGRMSAHHSDHYYDSHREYRGNPGEICKLGISKSNGEYQETRIDCKLMSSFIWEEERKQNSVVKNTVTTTVNVTRVEHTDSTNSNGTVVTTTTVQNKTVNALDVKGPSIQVTPGMTCFMIRISRDTSVLKKNVECGLLQAYAQRSFVNGSERNVPVITILFLALVTYFI